MSAISDAVSAQSVEHFFFLGRFLIPLFFSRKFYYLDFFFPEPVVIRMVEKNYTIGISLNGYTVQNGFVRLLIAVESETPQCPEGH